MKVKGFSRVLLAVAGLTFAFTGTNTAEAGWGSSGGSSGGSWGSYGSHGGSSGGSWGGRRVHHVAYASHGSSGGGSWGSSGGSSGGSWGSHGSSGGSSGHVGPLRRLAMKIHANRAERQVRRAYHASSGGSSGGSWGSHGSSGGSSGGWSHGSGSHGSSGGSWGGSHVSGGSSGGWGTSHASGEVITGETIISEVPVDGAIMESTPMEESPALDDSAAKKLKNRGVLAVSVPSDATLFVNGQKTKSKGDVRRFVSKELKKGFRYDYNVRAEFVRNGETVAETKVVSVRPGKFTHIAFDQSVVETSLTLEVPEDAKVLLSGIPTSAKGAVRKFSTSKIAPGQKWSDYTVQVVVERNGRTITKEKKIAINGGDNLKLAFDVDAGFELAAR